MRAGTQFQAALDAHLGGLSALDRRLAHEIAAGVLRRRSTLDATLAPLVSHDWDETPDDLKDVLRLGVYQLTELTRIPPYAAVQTAVELAKRLHGRRAGGMVNAVLRRLLREAASATRRPEAASHPAWLLERWTERWGSERVAALTAHNDRRAPLTLQPIRWSGDRLRQALTAAGHPWRDAPFGTGVSVTTGTRVTTLPGYLEGAFIVQDAAQSRLLDLAAIPADTLVWDACAAPGGKAAVLRRRGPVIASDVDPVRSRRLRETLRRAAPDVRVVLADARRPPFSERAVPVAVIDAPCSATGSMARHPDARWRLSARRLRLLAERQATLLDGVAPVIAPGGTLVYMTCSLEREENEDQVSAFLERHREFRRAADDHTIFPPDRGTDGGYVASLCRQ